MLRSLDNGEGVALVSSVEQLRDLDQFLRITKSDLRLVLLFGFEDWSAVEERLRTLRLAKKSNLKVLKLRTVEGLISLISQANCQKLVIGCPHVWLSRAIARAIHSRELVFLDDGMATFRLRSELQSQYQRDTRQVTFFSKFLKVDSDVWLDSWGEDYCDRNLKLNPHQLGVIGSPMLESGLLDERTFREYLKDIIETWEGGSQNVLYFPHRREIGSRRIVESQGMIWLSPNPECRTVEALKTLREVPQTYVTFYSSAILNVRLLLRKQSNAKFKVIRPNLNNISGLESKFEQALELSRFIEMQLGEREPS